MLQQLHTPSSMPGTMTAIMRSWLIRERELLKELPISGASPFTDVTRWKLCRVLGDTEGAWDAIQRAGKHGYYCWILPSTACLDTNRLLTPSEHSTRYCPRVTREISIDGLR